MKIHRRIDADLTNCGLLISNYNQCSRNINEITCIKCLRYVINTYEKYSGIHKEAKKQIDIITYNKDFKDLINE